MECLTCGASGALDDNFCARCGGPKRNSRLPVKRQPAMPPAVWQQAAPAVVRGIVLVAAGILGEWALRSATRRAVSLPFSGRKSRSKSKALAAGNGEALPTGITAISETLVVRRVVVKRS